MPAARFISAGVARVRGIVPVAAVIVPLQCKEQERTAYIRIAYYGGALLLGPNIVSKKQNGKYFRSSVYHRSCLSWSPVAVVQSERPTNVFFCVRSTVLFFLLREKKKSIVVRYELGEILVVSYEQFLLFLVPKQKADFCLVLSPGRPQNGRS